LIPLESNQFVPDPARTREIWNAKRYGGYTSPEATAGLLSGLRLQKLG
jgi:hypothetical protein